MDYERIRELHRQRPFEPFRIRTVDGGSHTVTCPEFLLQSRTGQGVLLTTDDGRDVRLPTGQIAALEVIDSATG